MSKTIIPEGYASPLGLYETQKAISLLKRVFEDTLSGALNLRRVSAPLLVTEDSGLNDNLNGVERPVDFDIPAIGTNAQIVHSLAKWKRLALYEYGFEHGSGLYTDMNAIRRDEELDNIHSIYVDQWDWEKVILREERTLEYLKNTVRTIVESIYETQRTMMKIYPTLTGRISKDIAFITSQELEDIYPSLSPKEREREYTKIHKTVFIMQIGKELNSGIPHDGRAPDYDDWELNGDLLVWNEILGEQLELSSMGIRVDAASLSKQLKCRRLDSWGELPFHKALLNNELPLTIGGGIGQSRLSLFILNKAHIGEVQVSVWDDDTKRICAQSGVKLL